MATTEDTSKSSGPLLIKVGERWVNVSAWRKSHPGGAASLDRFHGQDATEAFFSLHSKEALAKLDRMKSVAAPAELPPSPNATTVAFRKFREQLEKDGWFERSWGWDMFYVGQILFLCTLGTMLSYSYPLIATVLIGLGMQQAGWVAHDYVHGRGGISFLLGRGLGGLVNGFSAEWWSDKHNTHHVHTNQMGVDSDIANDPILHLWIPAQSKDYFIRRYQHLYYHVVYAFLYVSWRIQSFQWSWAHTSRVELMLLSLNYTWLLGVLPLKVAIGSVLLGGFLVSEIVTATHQSEEIIDGPSYTFVEDQFRTTRDVHSDNVLFNYLWGGMQFQLEHHLFPTMPKYRYQALVPLLQKWARENGVEYRWSPAIEIFKMNFNTMKKFAAMALEESN
eukprot:TRINITY_DN36_c0_g1_i1.p1 TRINITY_DN36_c0_g1~~TRINITY_DN36_c0_g1_i1.p1  ORF type:complete len:391 (+),score=133.43 TRINITY_DN36_c0_g1_i1:130-1302(+)